MSTLQVRFGGRPDIVLEGLSPTMTVAALRELVRQRLTTAEVQDKRLRFILRGRLLAADAVTLVQCGIRSGDTVHCVLSEGGHETAGEDVASTGPVDAPLSRTTTPNFGFDRLREAGYNDDEIGALRQQFHLHNGLVREDDETRLHHEEEWLSNSMNPSTTSDNAYMDIVVYSLVGFLFGFIVIFFLSVHRFKDRQVRSIVVGVLVNVFLGMMKP